MRVLIVCLGNICRSPMGEGALRARLDEARLSRRIEVDSAGTGDWHAGDPPDPRAIRCARGHGVDISGLRARQVRGADFEHFDWLLCADGSNLRDLQRIARRRCATRSRSGCPGPVWKSVTISPTPTPVAWTISSVPGSWSIPLRARPWPDSPAANRAWA